MFDVFNNPLSNPSSFNISNVSSNFMDRFNEVLSQSRALPTASWPATRSAEPFFDELISQSEQLGAQAPPSYDTIISEVSEDSSLEEAAGALEDVSEVTEAAEASSSLMGPVGIAMIAGQALGGAISSGITSSENNSSMDTYQSNLNKPGISAQQQSEAVAQSQRSAISSTSSLTSGLAMLGGPLGALIGYAISPSVNNLANVNFNTAYSNNGMFNPQNFTTVNSGFYSTDTSTNIQT